MRPVTVMGKEEKAMYNSTVATKNKAVGTFGKVKGMASQAFNGMLCLATMAMCSVNAFAGFSINTGYQIKDVQNLNPEQLILGLAFWLCRLGWHFHVDLRYLWICNSQKRWRSGEYERRYR